MDSLFYKVIHNKYLFNRIIKDIQENDFIKYRELKDIRVDNKIRFKNLNSLKWFLDNMQLQLLKFKLEANEYIDIDCNFNKVMDMVGDNQDDKELVKEIFKLLLNSNNCNCKSILSKLHLLNFELLDITINQFQHPILLSTINSAFENSSISTIKLLLDKILINNCSIKNENGGSSGNNEDIDEYKAKIILQAFNIKSIFQRDRVLKLILSNSNYYTPTSHIIKDQHKIYIDSICFELISLENQNQLLDLNYYLIPNSLKLVENKIIKIIKNLSQSKPVYNNNNNDNNNNQYNKDNIYSNQQNNQSNRINEIIKIIKTLLKVPNSIINFQPGLLFELDNLKLFLKNNKYNWKKVIGSINNDSFDRIITQSYPSLSLEYVEYYLSLGDKEKYCYFKPWFLEKAVKIAISKLFSRDKSKFIKFIKSVKVNSNNSQLILNWLEVINLSTLSKDKKSLIIKDVRVFDLVDDSQLFIHLDFKFENLQILECFKNSSFTLDPNIWSTLLRYPLENAINSFNLLEIKKLFKLSNWNIGHSSDINIEYNPLPNQIITKEDFYSLVELLNYYISCNNIQAVYYILELFTNDQIKSFILESNQGKTIQFGEDEKELLIWLFIVLIKRASTKKLDILLNYLNLNPLFQYPNEYYSIWSNSSNTINKLLIDINDSSPLFYFPSSIYYPKFNTQDYRYNNPDEIISTIKLFLNYSKSKIDEFKLNGSETISKEILDILINYLFKLLIQNGGQISIERIREVYQFINDSGIVSVQRSTLFSVYYLSNKSLKFIKYISGLPWLEFLDDQFGIVNFRIHDSTSTILLDEVDMQLQLEIEEIFDICKYINPDIFTFEMILGNNSLSFDTILELLINSFTFNYIADIFGSNQCEIADDRIQLSMKLINYNFEFFLTIRRIDLLLSSIQLFQNQHSGFFYQYFVFGSKFLDLLFKYDDEDLIITIIFNPLYSDKLKDGLSALINCDDQRVHVIKYLNEISTIKKIDEDHYTQSLFYQNFAIKFHEKIFNNNNTDNNNNTPRIIPIYKYPINMYKYLLNIHPNHKSLKLSKSKINIILKKNIYFIKQLLDNQLINNNNDNSDEYDNLLLYLNNQLKLNKDYKFINF